MGERKGTNKYYPPDYDPKAGGLNKFQGTHALRERARKIHLGIIIIRFELPYNIWCEGCNNHIGMGVRYNAEKTKVGMYYSTPVYQFKMKCHLCDNHFVIKTDPGNLDYIILSGARRQENRWDPTQNEQIVPETKETQKKLFDDSMYKLEHGTNDQNSAESAKPRLAKLFNRNEASWADCYTANQKLRAEFRKKSLDLKQSAAADKALLAKSSLDIPLMPEREEDRKTASLLSMKLKPSLSIADNTALVRKKIISASSLPTCSFTFAKERKAVRLLGSSVLKGHGNVVRRKEKRLAEKEKGVVEKEKSVAESEKNTPEKIEMNEKGDNVELERNNVLEIKDNVDEKKESAIKNNNIKRSVTNDVNNETYESNLSTEQSSEVKRLKLGSLVDYGSSSSESDA